MKAIITAILLILAFNDISSAQENKLFEFPLFQNAVKNGTRTKSGEPGPLYWQNSSDYKLEATIDTSKNILIGNASVIYHNNSPYKLYYLVFRLYQDNYKKGNVRNTEVAVEDLHDGTFIESLSVNGIEYIHNNKAVNEDYISRNYTVLYIRLRDVLSPGGSVSIDIGWNFHIPSVTYGKRMGRYADNFFIGLWYPQLAVFDDISWFDNISHFGSQEFYNDFNNYDVNIHLPEGYMVWATGECDNLSTLLDKKIIEKLNTAKTKDTILSILTLEDYKYHPVIGTNWHFKAEHVPDFAFAATLNYLWKATSIIVDPQTKRRTFVDVVYPEDTGQYQNLIVTAKETIKWASEVFPCIPYPYTHATSFYNGKKDGGSMEFPMIANDMIYSGKNMTSAVTTHELLHNYMPFYMGFNETRYGWMDEGWAMFLEDKFNGDSSAMNENENASYPYYAGSLSDQPLIYSTIDADAYNYYFHSYSKPKINLLLLEELLGKEVFLKASRAFMMIWNGKHPTPYDFFYSYNKFSNTDLNWFWKACYFDFGYADLGIKSVDKKSITIAKIGNIPVSIKLEIIYDDYSKEKIYKNLSIWENGENEYKIKLKSGKTIKKIILGDELSPDIDKSNNVYTN